MKRNRSTQRIAVVAIALLITCFTVFSRAAAQSSPFYWDSINVDIEVQTNGDMWVTETQTYVFNSAYSNQRYRYIPSTKVDDIQDLTVQENGKAIATETGRENDQFWIRWQHELAPPDRHTFVLRYRVIGGLQVSDRTTQVYWKAIFADRNAPVRNATVTVQLPSLLIGKTLSYTSYGAPTIDRAVGDRAFEFRAAQSIPPGQELEVQVAFPSEVLNLPKPQWQRFNLINSLIEHWYVVFFLVFPALAIFNSIENILSRRCPQCKTFRLTSRSRILVSPTHYSPGRRSIVKDCQNCGYHHAFNQEIPRTSSGYSSTTGGFDGGGGGFDGGGGGDGGGDGGGGGGGD